MRRLVARVLWALLRRVERVEIKQRGELPRISVCLDYRASSPVGWLSIDETAVSQADLARSALVPAFVLKREWSPGHDADVMVHMMGLVPRASVDVSADARLGEQDFEL